MICRLCNGILTTAYCRFLSYIPAGTRKNMVPFINHDFGGSGTGRHAPACALTCMALTFGDGGYELLVTMEDPPTGPRHRSGCAWAGATAVALAASASINVARPDDEVGTPPFFYFPRPGKHSSFSLTNLLVNTSPVNLSKLQLKETAKMEAYATTSMSIMCNILNTKHETPMLWLTLLTLMTKLA